MIEYTKVNVIGNNGGIDILEKDIAIPIPGVPLLLNTRDEGSLDGYGYHLPDGYDYIVTKDDYDAAVLLAIKKEELR